MPQSKTKAEVKDTPKKYNDLDILRYIELVDTVRTSKDPKRVNEAFEQIYAALKPRIRSLCSKFTISGKSFDDIMQEAQVALWNKAIKDYDQTRGSGEGPAAFDRFALLCIRRHLATELKTSHQNRNVPLNKAVSLDQERGESNDDLALINILPQTKGDVLMVLENREYFTKLITKLLSKLSKFEREVFLLYVEKYTYEEIADIINSKGSKNDVKIKGVDNALSRVKHKAHSIFASMSKKIMEEQKGRVM